MILAGDFISYVGKQSVVLEMLNKLHFKLARADYNVADTSWFIIFEKLSLLLYENRA